MRTIPGLKNLLASPTPKKIKVVENCALINHALKAAETKYGLVLVSGSSLRTAHLSILTESIHFGLQKSEIQTTHVISH
jgi:hypothetical protein